MAFIAIEQDQDSIREPLHLPPHEVRQLFEIAQTGATGSIGSLRDFLGTGAEIHLNCLSFLPIPVLLDRIRLFYRDNLGFHLRFSGDIAGEIYAFFGERDALALIERMLGQKRKPGKPLNRIEVSVLTEMVHIISNSFWRTMAERAALNWWFTPPVMVSDLSRSLAYSSKVYTLDHLLIHFEFLIPMPEIRFQYIILPSENTIEKLLSHLASAPAEADA